MGNIGNNMISLISSFPLGCYLCIKWFKYVIISSVNKILLSYFYKEIFMADENTTEVVEENNTESTEITLAELKTELDNLASVANTVLENVQGIMATMSDFVEAGATVAEKANDVDDVKDVADSVDDYVEDLEDLDFTINED